ncbi:MAG: ATP-binding protein [Planctomycetaceae bacterium]|nr:ATP-binding protein [Planctomycetaceae bacterium]
MTIHGVKGIEHGIIELPIENGLYAIVGNNGTGKSTIMSCLSQLIYSKGLTWSLKEKDYSNDSYVEFVYNGEQNRFSAKNGHWRVSTELIQFKNNNLAPKIVRTSSQTIHFNGTYEGSLFYGQRFSDSRKVDELLSQGVIPDSDIVEGDIFIVENMGNILHNKSNYYTDIKRIKNRTVASKLQLKNTPYFRKTGYSLISQYRMSSGECLLISLLHFIYNSIIRKSLTKNEPILMLIDEIELALHPIAITNLFTLLQGLAADYENLTVILTSHSPEVIRRIDPKNMYELERVTGTDNSFNIVNPCYPSYAIRDVYTNDGPDFLLLTEDVLAKIIVEKAIDELDLRNSRLINIIPVGGWSNVLRLQYELLNNNILGVGKSVFSILDGDVQNRITKEYKSLKKLFLPIPSVEKYLHHILITSPNYTIKKQINDRFFRVQSLDNLINEYKKDEDKDKKDKEMLQIKLKEDNDGKRFYAHLLKNMKLHQITEESFITGLYEIIIKNVKFDSFYNNLKKELT